MAQVGDLAVYVKTEQPDVFRSVTARGDFPRAVLESSFPGLWDIFLAGGIAAARCRRTLPAAKGYAGLLLSAPYAESYRLLSAALLSCLQRPLRGAFGTVTPVRLLSQSSGVPPITTISLDGKKTAPAPMDRPVSLRTFSPLRSPFGIGKEISAAQAELAEMMDRPEVAPAPGTPSWIITSVSLSETGSGGFMKGSAEVFSPHPFATLALRYALLKGFGSGREHGYGTLDFETARRKAQ